MKAADAVMIAAAGLVAVAIAFVVHMWGVQVDHDARCSRLMRDCLRDGRKEYVCEAMLRCGR